MTAATRIGIFTRGERPLHFGARCEWCKKPIVPPYWFWTPPVSQRGKARYRCDGCRHKPQSDLS